MNNKLQSGLLAVLTVAVLVLYYLHFSNRAINKTNDSAETRTTSYDEGLEDEADGLFDELSDSTMSKIANASGAMKIVFVNADSIITQYNYYKKLRTNMEAKAMRSERELEVEGRKLEQEYADAQKKAANMSQEQLAFTEQTLMKKQQNVMMLRESLAQELAEEEAKLDKQLREKVQSYFKRLSKLEGYDYVMSYHNGSNVIYGAARHDITSRVIADLNAEYAKEQKKK
ncbi:MAG: OmpH family outer membrane protein [Sphingobacteriaceae bacterium]|nr:OmpH family outer membrane protein [Sphingobacteriaceae bacterium]